MNTGLRWTPLADHLLSAEKQGLLLVSPFIQQSTLQHLLESLASIGSLQVVTRWNPNDIVSRVSDLKVYPYLKELNVPLYLNPRIHLKLTVFEADLAFHASANITNRGLGLKQNANIETGCFVELKGSDWVEIHRLLEESNRVDDRIYEQAKTYLRDNEGKHSPLPQLDYKWLDSDKEFSRYSLPFVQSPDLLWEYYSEDKFEGSRAAFVHDLILYSIDAGLDRNEFFLTLARNFRTHPFINAIANLIEREQELRFGAVNNWITASCTDKPVPFRWEMKPATNRVYNWLEFFFDKISWDQPRHSQIIRWHPG